MSDVDGGLAWAAFFSSALPGRSPPRDDGLAGGGGHERAIGLEADPAARRFLEWRRAVSAERPPTRGGS